MKVNQSDNQLESHENNNKENGVALALVVDMNGTAHSECAKKSLAERIPAFGIIMVLISVFFFSLQAVVVKVLTQLHAIQILTFRFGFQFIIYVVIVIVKRHAIFGTKESRMPLAVRCIAGTISLAAIYMAYRMMPIADAATINFSSPVFVIVIAHFMLNEPLSIVQILTGIFTLIGVILIAKPEFLFGKQSDTSEENRLLGTILAIVAAVTLAIVQISLRKLKNTAVTITLMWFGLTCLVSGALMLYAIDSLVWPSGWRTWCLLALCGVSGICDQFFYTMAFHYENAGPIAITRTFDIVLSFVWGVAVLAEEETWTSILGACIVSSSVVILGVYKWNSQNPQQFEKMLKKLDCRRKFGQQSQR